MDHSFSPTDLQNQLNQIQKERTMLRKDAVLKPKDVGAFSPSKDVHTLWEFLCNEMMHLDVEAYVQDVMEEATAAAQAEIGEEGMSDEAAALAAAQAPTVRPQLPMGQYTSQMALKVKPGFEEAKNAPTEEHAKIGGSTKAGQAFYKKMQVQANFMQDNLGLYGPAGVGSLQKVRQAESYAADGNFTATLRMLKSAKSSDPHNNTICYLVSQACYALVLAGNTDLLPEARSEAQKSANASEHLPPELLMLYRYEAAAVERAITDKKSTEWLKEFYLLDVEPISGQEGLGRAEGDYLKPWLLLANSKPGTWGDYIFESIAQMATHAVGGAALYIHLLRPLVEAEVKKRAVPPSCIEDLEKNLGTAYAAYTYLSRAFGTWQTAEEQFPWTVRNRFLSDFYNAGKFPTFDEVLMNVSLSGRGYEMNATPVQNFKNFGYHGENYWRLWAIVLAPEQAKKINNMLPAVETELEKKIYKEFETAFAKLVEAETALLDMTDFADCQPHMMTFTMDHLVGASTKKKDARSAFAPAVSPFSNLYRQWNEGAPAQVRPSDIIKFAASQGGFGSAQEVLAAIDGAFILIKDPTYGLKKPANRREENCRTDEIR